MPGILPMKVIKVGTSAQSRIAQACDRCRSKKIRCDGITPCCSQCANVGFECKTSDKLSRRAFPRGYTESLEERVRALEGEVKELKDLLDEKDEKIDIISRINSNSSPKRPSLPFSPTPSVESKPCNVPKEDIFRMQQCPFLTENEKADSYFMGTSSSRAFVDSVKGKIQESGKPCANFNINAFFPTGEASTVTGITMLDNGLAASGVPPRLISDQLMNIFFQEWAPMYPVLHRPTFLKLYADYTADPQSISNLQAVAQLHLVFGIAALSSECNKETIASSESQWKTALNSVMSDNSLSTLQCLVLAQMYCICKADYDSLVRYNGVAVSLAYRLGLHQSQKRFSLGALTRETRKKVFWSLYTVDCFSAALLGLPKLLKDGDIHTEYPSDVDDENVTERGFQPTLPGESTRLSSALALFRLARIMSEVLTEIYPSASSHNLSLQQISALGDRLDTWRDELAPHLRLQFVQDKPSTNVVSSRSPLLSLAFYFIRTLIHRPAVISSLGAKAPSSTVALADSSKHIIQIVQLLEERRMSFAMCLNKDEVLLLAGLSLILQGLNIKQEGKLMHDNQRLVSSVITILERNAFSGAATLKKIACSTIAIEQFVKPPSPTDRSRTSRRDSIASSLGPQAISKFARQGLQAVTSRFSFATTQSTKHEMSSTRRSTAPSLSLGLALHSRNLSQASISSVRSEPIYSLARSPLQAAQPQINSTYTDGPNLDYLSFSNDESLLTPSYTADVKDLTDTSEWESLLGFIDASETFLEDNSYSSCDPLSSYVDTPSQTDTFSNFLQDPEPPEGTHEKSPKVWPTIGGPSEHSASTQSDFSLSEESATSGEDWSSCELGAEYRGIVMPNFDAFDGLEG